MATKPPWQCDRFGGNDSDPLLGFANLMDVMLVFALGLILALVSQTQEFRKSFSEQHQGTAVKAGRELTEKPQSLQRTGSGDGMESLGQVFRDPKTGKLILVSESEQ